MKLLRLSVLALAILAAVCTTPLGFSQFVLPVIPSIERKVTEYGSDSSATHLIVITTIIRYLDLSGNVIATYTETQTIFMGNIRYALGQE